MCWVPWFPLPKLHVGTCRVSAGNDTPISSHALCSRIKTASIAGWVLRFGLKFCKCFPDSTARVRFCTPYEVASTYVPTNYIWKIDTFRQKITENRLRAQNEEWDANKKDMPRALPYAYSLHLQGRSLTVVFSDLHFFYICSATTRMLSAAIWFSSLCTFMYLRLKEENNGWTSNICAIAWKTIQFFVLFLLMTCHQLKSYSRKLWRCLPLREKLTMSCLLGYVWLYLYETLTIPQQDQVTLGSLFQAQG